MNYNQGDIVLVWFPDSNLLTAKKRPAVILQKNNLQTGIDQVIIGMITSNILRSGHGSRIFIDINTEIGRKTALLSNSIIMTDNIATVQFKEIYKKIGTFSDIDLLKKSIKYTFDI